MNSKGRILVAFLLNLFFSIFEIIGGFLTNSISIMSDSLHDLADALSIGISYFLEKKSEKGPNDIYTYGYTRYSSLGALVTVIILIVGSLGVIISGIYRIMNPTIVKYDGMIVFAIVGIIINFLAVLVTSEGKKLNQKAVNLHMLEDVLGWVVVLIGATVIKFTKLYVIDSIMSILVSLFIFMSAIHNLKEILDLFLEKSPSSIKVKEVEEKVLSVKGVKGVHHIHLWCINEEEVMATMHVVSENNFENIKKSVKEALKECGISHITIEMESEVEECYDKTCQVKHEVKHTHKHK